MKLLISLIFTVLLGCSHDSSVCANQDLLTGFSQACVIEKCSPLSFKAHKDQIIIGLYDGGQIRGITSIDIKSRSFLKVPSSAFYRFKNLFVSEKLIQETVNPSVDFDGVESERCSFQYNIPSLESSKEVTLVFSQKSETLNKKVFQILETDKKLYRKHHPKCHALSERDEKGQGCNYAELYALTDIDNNGSKEFWSVYTSGYRYWYLGEEFDQNTGEWKIIYSY